MLNLGTGQMRGFLTAASVTGFVRDHLRASVLQGGERGRVE